MFVVYLFDVKSKPRAWYRGEGQQLLLRQLVDRVVLLEVVAATESFLMLTEPKPSAEPVPPVEPDSPDAQDDGLFLSPEVREVKLIRLSQADLLQHGVVVQSVVLQRRVRPVGQQLHLRRT